MTKKTQRETPDSVLQEMADLLLGKMIEDIANIVCEEYGLPDMEKVAMEALYSVSKKSETWTNWKIEFKSALKLVKPEDKSVIITEM